MKIEEIIKTSTEIPAEKRVLLSLLYTEHIISERFSEILKPFDLSAEQFNVLRILRGQKGKPLNMSCIQERMIARTSNTTRLVDKLLAKEYVNRDTCNENRRKIEITITQKGLNILEQLDTIVEHFEKKAVSKLTSNELFVLTTLLEKIREK